MRDRVLSWVVCRLADAVGWLAGHVGGDMADDPVARWWTVQIQDPEGVVNTHRVPGCVDEGPHPDEDGVVVCGGDGPGHELTAVCPCFPSLFQHDRHSQVVVTHKPWEPHRYK